MTTIIATNARNKLNRLVDEVSESHEPVHISDKRNAEVFISVEDWATVQETLHLTSIPDMRDSIIEGIRPLDC